MGDLGNTTYFGKISTVLGYGETENGTRGKLLKADVTVIENQECKNRLQRNITNNPMKQTIAKQFCTQLPMGLNEAFLCSQGIWNNEKGVFSEPCKGDSGGPLNIKDDKDRTTLIGIISGGIGCGEGYPSWYTKVAYYKDWIDCVIENSILYDNNQKKVEETCKEKTSVKATCVKSTDLIVQCTDADANDFKKC